MATSVAHELGQINARLAAIEQILKDRVDEMLDIDGAAILIGRTRSALYQLTCSHDGEPPEIPHYKTGKRLFFRRSELVAWMTAHPVKHRAAVEAEARAFVDKNFGK